MAGVNRRGLLLEIIVCSVADAIEAARGGADRLEVARDMDRQGLTPSIEMVREIMRSVRLPLRVMVRETGGFRCDESSTSGPRRQRRRTP
jgi:copper homeostasis protein